MDEVTKTEGSTTINQYPNGNGWGGRASKTHWMAFVKIQKGDAK